MADLNARMERAIEEMAGNEALLEMLETDAAKEMLNWGIATARSVNSRTREIDDRRGNRRKWRPAPVLNPDAGNRQWRRCDRAYAQ